MPELRRDPIVGRWVIIATERARRPSDLQRCPPAPQPSICPFCAGHEEKTPAEVYVSGRSPAAPPNSPGWRVRVVPNRFPALKIEGDLDRQAEGIYDRMNGIGAHEVIIETPDHGRQMKDLSDAELRRLSAAVKSWSFEVIGTRSWLDAQVTAGGVAAGQIVPETMESRLVPGLFFAGEIIDVDGDSGGFNLQWAWSSGRLAGSSAAGRRSRAAAEGK